ncbi:hypothetical protein GCM10009780_16760 [Actinomadura alba]
MGAQELYLIHPDRAAARRFGGSRRLLRGNDGRRHAGCGKRDDSGGNGAEAGQADPAFSEVVSHPLRVESGGIARVKCGPADR